MKQNITVLLLEELNSYLCLISCFYLFFACLRLQSSFILSNVKIFLFCLLTVHKQQHFQFILTTVRNFLPYIFGHLQVTTSADVQQFLQYKYQNVQLNLGNRWHSVILPFILFKISNLYILNINYIELLMFYFYFLLLVTGGY